MITMKYRIELFATTTAHAVVFVNAISKEDAREIAIASCDVDDFEISQLVNIEAMDVEQL